MSTVRTDFDLIAQFPPETWDHNSQYHNFLLEHVPSPCRQSLEIGCGTGSFSRLLAKRSERVIALDLSPNMIRIAEKQSALHPNIEFRVGDVMEQPVQAEQFDCIAAIATLHHLPLKIALLNLKSALKVNGVLLILDLIQEQGVLDTLRSAIALPASIGLKLAKGVRIIDPPEVRAAWSKHALNDSYLTMDQVHDVFGQLLPGAQIRRHLFWRYSVVWRKPA